MTWNSLVFHNSVISNLVLFFSSFSQPKQLLTIDRSHPLPIEATVIHTDVLLF